MFLAAAAQPKARDTILTYGFFYGWNQNVVLASCCMWLQFFVSSAVTAYISAMAGAMGSAVVVIVVGGYDVFVRGKELSVPQGISIVAISCITTLYTLLKDRHNKAIL